MYRVYLNTPYVNSKFCKFIFSSIFFLNSKVYHSSKEKKYFGGKNKAFLQSEQSRFPWRC